MFYEFPIITNIADVLPAIQDRPEFIVAEKEGYKVVNYMVNMEDTFPPIKVSGGDAKMRTMQTLYNAIRRECRGSKFDSETGAIIARPYHKFFNVGERAEVMLPQIDLAQEHVIIEKLDGSMIHPMRVNGSIRWCTKMGITDTSMQAEEFVARNPQYQEFALSCNDAGCTPIFEWCSNKNRIVLDYPEDQLVLTAVRHMIDGDYYPYSTLENIGQIWNIPIVGKKPHSISEIAALENTEGIVIRFNNGHMLKMKCEWYVLRHKSKDAIMREKNVMEYILTEKVDDVIPYLTVEDATKLVDFQHQVMAQIIGLTTKLDLEFVDMQSAAKGNRRVFAEMNQGPYKQILFKALDGHNIYDFLLKFLASKTGTQSGVDSIRHMIGGLKWDYSFAKIIDDSTDGTPAVVEGFSTEGD
jgi:RNA ligase